MEYERFLFDWPNFLFSFVTNDKKEKTKVDTIKQKMEP